MSTPGPVKPSVAAASVALPDGFAWCPLGDGLEDPARRLEDAVLRCPDGTRAVLSAWGGGVSVVVTDATNRADLARFEVRLRTRGVVRLVGGPLRGPWARAARLLVGCVGADLLTVLVLESRPRRV